ncbi:MAG TPA: hypothetical protein DIT28_10065 [Oxalobacteraceae bacterium]|nr:hypothetical protein [Oxalobacteraceae bacterium]
MDQLNIGVTVDASNAVDGLTKVSTSIDKVQTATEKMNTANVNAARMIAQNELESRRFISALQEEVNTYGKGKEAVLQYRASQLGVANEAKGLIDQLKQVNGGEIKAAGAAMEQFGFQSAGAKRELLVLAHELSQGNFKRAAGSAMVLGERVNVMGLIFSGTGLAIGVAAGAVVGFAIAAAKGTMESIKFRDTMKMTGDYAGITASQFDTLAEKISVMSSAKIGNARESLQALVGTGRFSGDALEYLGEAAVKMERLTGQSAEETVKDFAKMSDGVAKWVIQHNESMHLVSLAQLQHIEELENAGKKEEAYIEVAKLLNAQTDVSTSKLGTAERAWRSITSAISGAIDAMKSVGRNDPTQVMNDRIKSLQFMIPMETGFNKKDSSDKRAAQQAELTSLLAQKVAAEAAVAKKSQDDMTQEKGIAAHERLNAKWREMAGSINLADKEIQKFRTDYQSALAANPNDKDALDAKKNASKIEGAIRKKYDKTDFKSERKTNSAYDSSFQSLGADKAKMDDEIAQYNNLGKVVDKSRLAVVNFEIASGKLKGLSADRANTLRSMASTADAEAKQLAGIKSTTENQTKLNDTMAKWSIGQDRSAAQMQFNNDLYGKSALEVAKLTEAHRIELDIEDKIRLAQEKGAITQESIARFRSEGAAKSNIVNKISTQAVGNKIAGTLKTPEESEKLAYKNRISDLKSFQALSLENTVSGNELIERENQRHESAMLDMQTSRNLQSLSSAASTFDMLYGMMQKAGTDQSALGKAAFLVSKAIAVEEIIMQTNVAAAKAKGQLGIWGIPLSISIMATGYAQAGMVAGMAIAGARENGGPVMSDSAYMVGEKGPEIFRPTAGGTIIPNSKIGGGGGDLKLTIVNNTRSPIGQVTEQRISANERALIISESVAAGAAQFDDPNSRSSKALSRNFNTPRMR